MTMQRNVIPLSPPKNARARLTSAPRAPLSPVPASADIVAAACRLRPPAFALRAARVEAAGASLPAATRGRETDRPASCAAGGRKLLDIRASRSRRGSTGVRRVPYRVQASSRQRRARTVGHLLSDFITLFVVVDPLAASSVFLAVTAAYTTGAKRKIATLAVLFAFLVLLFFIALGQIIIEAMGISLRAFQIAGGIVLFLFAVSMILAEPAAPAGGGDAGVASVAVYPLAIPAIAGPGTMLTVMLLTDNDRFGIGEQAITTTVAVAVLLIQYALLLAAEPVSRLIGKSGASILRRVMGMILASVAVNAVLAALGSWLGLPKL